MTAVPQGYPFSLSDDELDSSLSEMMDPASWPGFDDFGRLLPELKLALLAAGIHERSSRQSNLSAQHAIRLASAAVWIAATTLIASIVLAFVR